MSTKAIKMNFSSSEFLKNLQKKDSNTIEVVVKTYTKQLLNASFGLGFTDSDSQELVQSVWVTFFQRVHTFEGRSHVRTYLFGILYNKAKELKRDRHKYTSDSPFDEVMAQNFDMNGMWIKEPVSPDSFLESSQTLEIIQRCMDLLPLQQKLAFHLKEVELNKTEEICNILEVSSTNLGVLLYRAKNKLRTCIERKSK